MTPSADLAPTAPLVEDQRGKQRWAPDMGTCAFVGLLAWALYLGLAPLRDNSFLTHLATGRLILAEGSIPAADPYTFTGRGESWVVQSWLASVLYAVAERLGGATAIRLTVALATVALVGIIWRLTRPVDGLVARLAVAASAVAVGSLAWGPRPLMFGLLFLGIALLAAQGAVKAWWLVPVCWLWANVHGSYPLGILALMCLCFGRYLDREDGRTELRALIFAVTGCLLGVVGPLGINVLTFPLTAIRQQDRFEHIVEWQSASFASWITRLFAAQVVLALILLLRRRFWRAGLPMVVFVVLAATATRNIGPASLVLLPGMAASAQGLGDLKTNARSRATRIVFACLVVLGMLIAISRISGSDWDLRRYPVDAVAWMEQNGYLDPSERRIAPDYAGNFLELLLGPDAGVFQDDRVDMLPSGVVDDGVALLRGTGDHDAILERWDPDVILWSTKQPLAEELASDPAWSIIYRDDEWLVAVPE